MFSMVFPKKYFCVRVTLTPMTQSDAAGFMCISGVTAGKWYGYGNIKISKVRCLNINLTRYNTQNQSGRTILAAN